MRLERRPRSPAGAIRGGFTLIELMISAALMALVLGAAYACLQAGLATRRMIEPRSDRFQSARVALSLLTADLRGACPLHKGPEFLGATRMLGTSSVADLSFATHHFTPRRDGEGDYACVGWFVEKDPVTGEAVLMRRRLPGLVNDPLSGGRREEILRPLLAWDVRYSDGYEWFESWGDRDGGAKQAGSFKSRPNLVGMPRSMRIVLTLPGEPLEGRDGSAAFGPPIRFETEVRIEVDPTAAASPGGTTPSSPGNPAGATPNNPPFP